MPGVIIGKPTHPAEAGLKSGGSQTDEKEKQNGLVVRSCHKGTQVRRSLIEEGEKKNGYGRRRGRDRLRGRQRLEQKKKRGRTKRESYADRAGREKGKGPFEEPRA